MAHVTDILGLRFGIVDVDEIKGIVHPFHASNFSASSVLSNLSLHSQFSSIHPHHASAAQSCPRLMELRKETGRENVSGLDDEGYAITASNIG